MRPLNHKADLIPLLRQACPTKACERAFDEGWVTVLGGFAPAGGFPYYLATVRSINGRTWYVGVRVDTHERKYRPFWLQPGEEPDWQNWDGVGLTKDLRNGDMPEVASLRRADALRKHHEQQPPTP